MNEVVITGIGIIAPSGVGKAEFWRNNTAGLGCLSHEPLMERIGMRSRVVSRASEFRLAEHHEPGDLPWFSRLSRFAQFGVTVGAMVAGDAGLPRAGRGPLPGVDPGRAGVVFSSAIGGTPEFQDAYENLSEHGAHPIDAFPEDSVFYDSVFLNYAPAWTARTFGLRGPCTSLTTGCTAGIDALGLGFDLVRQGELDLVVTAAAEAPLSGLAYATLDVIGSLAVGDWPPERASRPFDARRGGFVLGEGAAAVVLENKTTALARGARIYGEVLGYSSQNNARHMTDLAPDGDAMASVLSGVLRVAGAEPHQVDYVNAHGSSTPQNDVFETQALKTVLGEHAYKIPVSSTKSMIGHSLSAASLTGVVATIGAIQTGMVPPTVNYEFPDPDCDLDYVPNTARRQHVGTALVMASGFGGIHSGALLRRWGTGQAALSSRRLSDRGLSAAGEDSTGAGAAGEDTAGGRRPASLKTVGQDAAPQDAASQDAAPQGAAPQGAAGPGAAGPVLFLHGFGGDSAHWAPLRRELGDMPAVAVDLPGHGANSGTPAEIPVLDLDADLADLCAASGGPGGAVVAGHSLGALLALRLAVVAPHRVRALILLTTGLPFRVHPALAGYLSSGDAGPRFLAGALRRPSDAAALRLVSDGFRRMRPAGQGNAVWGISPGETDIGDLGRVSVPVLVIVAGKDIVTSPRKGRALAAALPAAELVVLPDAGHYVHLEEPALIAGHVRDFLARLPVPVPAATSAPVPA